MMIKNLKEKKGGLTLLLGLWNVKKNGKNKKNQNHRNNYNIVNMGI